jgi:CHASE1-domain containing sensor protein
MNPGPTEVATSFMDAMKSQPVMLGLVVMNLSMVAMLYVVIRFSQDQRRTEFEMIFKSQTEVQRLLAQCVIPPKDGG